MCLSASFRWTTSSQPSSFSSHSTIARGHSLRCPSSWPLSRGATPHSLGHFTGYFGHTGRWSSWISWCVPSKPQYSQLCGLLGQLLVLCFVRNLLSIASPQLYGQSTKTNWHFSLRCYSSSPKTPIQSQPSAFLSQKTLRSRTLLRCFLSKSVVKLSPLQKGQGL